MISYSVELVEKEQGDPSAKEQFRDKAERRPFPHLCAGAVVVVADHWKEWSEGQNPRERSGRKDGKQDPKAKVSHWEFSLRCGVVE